MNILYKDIVYIPLLIGLTVNTIFLPIIKKICLHYDFLDRRNESQKVSIRCGGVSMFIGLFLTFLFLINRNFYLSTNFLDIKTLSLVFTGISLFSLLGMLDDIYNLSPFLRLILQITIASYIWSNGIAINIPIVLINFLPFLSSSLFSFLFTVIWITGITNSINWLDGLDGLASGYTLIASLCFIYMGILNNQILGIVVAVFLFGTTISFLKYNFFPSKIYMGDGGSYLLGSSLALISLLNINQYSSINNICLNLIILYIPLSDMFQVVTTRLLAGISPFYPDKRHLHHRIRRLGFSHRSTVLIIYSYALIIFFLLFLSINLKLNNLIVLTFLSISLLLVKFFKKDLIKLLKNN